MYLHIKICTGGLSVYLSTLWINILITICIWQTLQLMTLKVKVQTEKSKRENPSETEDGSHRAPAGMRYCEQTPGKIFSNFLSYLNFRC